jgi:16S rRNA (cytosine967-C5)-methyltransferase
LTASFPPAGRGGRQAARLVAFDVMRQVWGDGAYANLALAAALDRAGLSRPDAAFATELVAGTCRGRGTYDAILVRAAGRPLASLQPAVIDLLRLGAHQILSTRLPTAVAVAASVDLAAATVGRRVTGLVNAVLRRVGRHSRDEWLDQLTQDLDPVEALALRASHPRWIAQAHVDLLGLDEARAALEANNRPPEVVLAVRPGLASPAAVLAQAGPGARPGRWSPQAVRLTGDPGRLAAVRRGLAGVSDEGSQLIALGLARPPAPAGPWLDLCAGPGGKAALLAGLAQEWGERLLANEFSPARARLTAAAVQGYPRTATVIVADGRRPAWREGSFSRVLVDAPCSGLGALRRRPDARWRKQPSDLPGLVRLQRALLDSALAACAVDGLVAYATCSPHPQETVAVVERALAGRRDLELVEAATVWGGIPDASRGPYLQLWPQRHDTDAMFCALLRRRG